MRTFLGEKLFVGGGEAENIFRKTSISPFYLIFGTAKPRKRMSAYLKTVFSRLKNRLAQNVWAFFAIYKEKSGCSMQKSYFYLLL